MRDFYQKLHLALTQLENEHDEISLFAIFLRDNSLDLWDLIVSAQWLNSSDLNSLKIVCSKIQDSLKGSEILKLSHVVILDIDDPTVIFLRENYEVLHGHPGKLIDPEILSERLNFTIKRAYLLRCLNLSSDLDYATNE